MYKMEQIQNFTWLLIDKKDTINFIGLWNPQTIVYICMKGHNPTNFLYGA